MYCINIRKGLIGWRSAAVPRNLCIGRDSGLAAEYSNHLTSILYRIHNNRNIRLERDVQQNNVRFRLSICHSLEFGFCLINLSVSFFQIQPDRPNMALNFGKTLLNIADMMLHRAETNFHRPQCGFHWTLVGC